MPDEDRHAVPAVTGVQPDAPNAVDPERHDLAMGPPAIDDTAEAHPTADGS